MDCPGHTKGHIAYHMPSEEAVFAGDTLFSLGCGRVFEGTHGGDVPLGQPVQGASPVDPALLRP